MWGGGPCEPLQLYLSTGQVDYLNLCRCYQFLDDAAAIAGVVVNLLAFNQEVRLCCCVCATALLSCSAAV